MFNLNNANMENLITQINKERLVNSDTALMMKELYYYVPCEYWYDKLDRLRTDVEGRNTPMVRPYRRYNKYSIGKLLGKCSNIYLSSPAYLPTKGRQGV